MSELIFGYMGNIIKSRPGKEVQVTRYKIDM